VVATTEKDTVIGGRYRLEERVGAGSMGAVWRGTDELLNRVVAVKQLLLQPGAPGFDGQTSGYGDARERIEREGRLAARLQHANTIGVYDLVLHDEVPWLVMEYLESRTLGGLLTEEGPLEPRRAAEIGRQIADGLAAAHAAGIVHRDIKPSNVLIGLDGTVKITDFGVSRAADDVQLTRTGLIAGTPAYLAPEVARGQTPTPASDVFALGSTIYASVEGTPPFGLNDNAYAMLYTVGGGEVRPPQRAGALTGTLMWMLDKDPDRRPTAAQARDELALVAAGRPAARGYIGPSPTLVGQPVRAAEPPVIPPLVAAPEPGDAYGAGGTRVDLARPGHDEPPPPVGAGAGGARTGPSGAGRPVPGTPAPGRVAPGHPGPGRIAPDRGVADRPPGGAAQSGRGTGGPGRRGWWAAVAAALLLLVAAVVGISLAGSPSGTGTGTAAPPQASRTPVPAPTPSSTPSSKNETPSNNNDSPRPATEDAEALEDFVRDYYALLPDDVDKAWDLLGPTARRQSGSLESYRRFYSGISKVRFADGPTAVDGRTVRASLLFDTRDQQARGAERYEFTVEPGPNGQLMMTSFSH
jgi:hypothetical protein